LVKADLTLKVWGRKFRTLAANLPELKRQVAKLPGFNFPNVLTADSEELGKMHRSYVEAIQQKLGVIGPTKKTAGKRER